jgi:uncharacterized protein (DUF58 family)
MIKKRAYGTLAILSFGLMESYVYNLYGYQVLTYFFLALIFIIVSDLWIMNNGTFNAIKEMEVRRNLRHEEMKKGDEIKIELLFKNNSKRKLQFEYFDTLPDVFKLSGDFKGYVTVKPGEVASRFFNLTAEAIGKYQVGPIKIIVKDALGLGFVEFICNHINYAYVGPSPKDTFMKRSDRVSNVLFTNGLHMSKKAGIGYNFFGIRAYNESDSMRHVDWNRYNIFGNDELFVKEWEEERQIDTVIVIDYSLGSNIGYGENRLFDFMVSSAINASNSILKNQDRVGYIIFSSDHKIYIKPSSRSVSIENLQKKVAQIRPTGEFNLGEANDFIRKNVKKNALIFIMLSPYSGKVNSALKPSELRMAKQEYAYIINPLGFYKIPKEDGFITIGTSILTSENKVLDSNVKFYRKFGIIARNVYKEKLLVSLLSDYINGRDSNRGA